MCDCVVVETSPIDWALRAVPCIVNRIQHKIMSMWYRRSPTSTVISGSGTGVAAIGTISGSGGGKATLRPSIFGGVVVWAIAGPPIETELVSAGLPILHSFPNYQ